MAEPICEDEGLMQEWTPLTQLLQQIPLKSQRGLFSKNLNLTCLDVVSEFIALGTNLGFLYWYCRATGDLQRLRLENFNCSVTCVKIMLFADYMVAAGTDQGTVIVFHIPKLQSVSTQNQVQSKNKQMERFTINGLHQAAITSIEWNTNEMKVFTGDKNGSVVLTEINLSLHISKSMELLNEQFEIVQLSYCQDILLISTVYRSIICDGSNNWKVCQVGTKERKILGKFGAALCKFPHGLVLFASRPGHRLWLSDKSGVVQQTLIFKSAIQSNCPKIQLINPIDKKEPLDSSFGKIIQFGDNKLITYNSEIMYVLHPGAVSVTSVLNGARKILDLSVNENEIFILEGERSLLRIGALPDKYSLEMLYQPVSRRTSFNFDEFAAKLKDTAVESIKKIKDFIPVDEQISSDSPPALADEALELPPVITLPPGLMPSLYTQLNNKTHSLIPNQDLGTSDNSFPIKFNKQEAFSNSDMNSFSVFNQDLNEEIIIRPLRKRHNKKTKLLPYMQSSVILSESGSDTTTNQSEDRLVCGVANDLSLSDESAFSESQSSFSLLRDISFKLTPFKRASKNNEEGSEEMMKTSDTKSQTSLDTCESVSERLLLTTEPFRQEQEKAFGRFADHSLLDSCNSEKTDMSISLNISSSSVSSKISENLPSPSYTSENTGVGSEIKSGTSQNTENFENEQTSPSQGCWKWDSDFVKRNCSREEEIESLKSNRNSQIELGLKWQENESENKNCTMDGNLDTAAEFPSDRSEIVDEVIDPITKKHHQQFALSENISLNRPADNKIIHSAEDSEFRDTSKVNSFQCSGNFNDNNFFRCDNILVCQQLQKKDGQAEDEGKKVTEFPSNEFLSYGPPSGSSMLSSQPSSYLTSISIGQQSSLPFIQDFFDHWPQYKTPEKITSLAACKNYVICTDYRDRVYYSHLSGLSLSWKQLDYKASMIRVTSDGSAVWLLNKKTVSALVNPSLNSPISDSVEDIAHGIKSFATDSINKDGLLVSLTGKIINFNNVMKGMQDKEIACDHIITDVACSGGVILAVSNDRSVLYKLPEESQFKVLKTPKPTSSLALGPGNLLWVVDVANNIFFSDDYVSEYPHWWQIQISDYIFQNHSGSFQNICSKMKLNELKASIQMKNSLVATNDNSVWIYNKFDSIVCVNKTGFTGYMWNKVSSIELCPSIQWQTLSAGGVFEDKGCMWVLSLDGNIFCASPNYQLLQSIPVPCEGSIVCMTSSVDTLWILSESGSLYKRLGLSSDNKSGTSWREIKSLHIDNLRFVWISCGTDVAWACDIHGRTFISIGSPHHTAALDPTWVEVEGRPKDVHFEKVFVGSRLYVVWAIDSNRNLYVREGIFPHYQIGTNWVYVCGIEAIDVTISGTHVWALTTNGKIYRRCGVTESNSIGDYWRSIPGNMKVISSSLTDELWGVSQENKILRLSFKLKILRQESVDPEEPKESRCLKDDLTWEIIK